MARRRIRRDTLTCPYYTPGMADYLRHVTDAELRAIEDELVERLEFFDQRVRTEVKDELRRRKMVPTPRRRLPAA